MRQAIPGLIFSGLVAICSIGCTGQAVVVQQDTSDVVGLIDESVTATREYYRDLGQKQFDVLVEFIAARPSCGVESPLLLVPAEDRCLTDDEKLLRRDCMADASTPECLRLPAVREVPASPDVTQPRQTTVTLLATLASYQRALARVLNDPTYDSAGDFADVVSRLGELCNQIAELAAIAGGDGEAPGGSCDALDVRAITDKDTALGQQAAAASTLLDLVRRANEDRADYAALSGIVAEKGPAVDAALESLLSTYEQVDAPFADLLARREIERKRREYNDMSADERSALPQEARERLVREIYEPELARLQAVSQPDAIAAGLRGLIRSHQKLEESFRGNLTESQRKRAAAENQQQVRAAFQSMLSIVKLFN
jgi:hypothetical protein